MREGKGFSIGDPNSEKGPRCIEHVIFLFLTIQIKVANNRLLTFYGPTQYEMSSFQKVDE